jgi:hypothetical protein
MSSLHVGEGMVAATTVPSKRSRPEDHPVMVQEDNYE